ncbi:hypothetical protein [Methylobrevis pamukkalensis]|nr:hypothetical protein [Methylobrevis pamukkalensis]
MRLAQGALGGAALGALLGAGIMAAAGGNSQQIGRAALIGGGTGAVAGGLYANNVNQQVRPEAEAQARYQRVIAEADANIARYAQIADAAGRVRADEEAKVARLNGQLASGAVTASQYRAELSSARSNIRALETQIANVDQNIEVLDAAYREGAVEAGSRLGQLRAQKATLEARKLELSRIYSRVPPSVGLGV